MRYRLFRLAVPALLVLGILLGPACSKKPEGKPADDEEVTLRLQIHWDAASPRGQAIRAILDRFEADHQDIKVTLLGGSGEDTKLLTQIAGGNPPDVIETSYRNVQVLAQAGVLRPLDELAKDESSFYAPLWELGFYEDTLYGYPWFGHTIQLVYNRTRFNEAGIAAPPKTWDELHAAAVKLTRDTDGDGKPDRFGLSLPGKQHGDLSWLFTMFLHQAGGKLVERTNGKWRVAINSEEGLEALDFYLKLIHDTCPPGAGTKMGGDVMADFRNGIAAMEFQGPWGVTDIWTLPPEQRFDASAAEAPAGPGGRAAELGANMTVIPKTCKQPKAALKLIAFLGGREAQTMIMEGEKTETGFVPFRVPVRTDLEDIPAFEEHPEFLPFVRGFAWPSIEAPIPQWVRIRDEVYIAELNKAVLELTTPQAALAAIEREGNRILSE